ncbi:hypothetical protein [Planobispora rosea]|nr:hypothetical protein [Planobispora rosea]
MTASLTALPVVTPGVRPGAYRIVSFDGCSSLKAPATTRSSSG